MSARRLAQVAGKAVSMTLGHPMVKVLTREVFRLINALERGKTEWDWDIIPTERVMEDLTLLRGT